MRSVLRLRRLSTNSMKLSRFLELGELIIVEVKFSNCEWVVRLKLVEYVFKNFEKIIAEVKAYTL